MMMRAELIKKKMSSGMPVTISRMADSPVRPPSITPLGSMKLVQPMVLTAQPTVIRT